MENKKEIIEKEIEKTLDVFNSLEKMTPDPHFYSKLQRRLEIKNNNEKPINLFLKPAFLIILIIFNITSIIWYSTDDKTETNQNLQNGIIEVLSNDLNINQTQENILFEK